MLLYQELFMIYPIELTAGRPEDPLRGLEHLREISRRNGLYLFDKDDTYIEQFKYRWPDGVERRILPEAVEAFRAIKQAGNTIGTATEQSRAELEQFLTDTASLVIGRPSPYEFMNGTIIFEGGNCVRYGEGHPREGETDVLASPEAIEERHRLLEWLYLNIEEHSDGWGVLSGTDLTQSTLVKLPDEIRQGVATLSLWERGPHVTTDPAFVPRYDVIRERVMAAIQELGLRTLEAYEAGNGTLRIGTRGINKGTTLERLAALGLVAPADLIYFCDGPNDIGISRFIRRMNGGVVAVNNAVDEVKEQADYVCASPSGRGMAEAVSLILG